MNWDCSAGFQSCLSRPLLCERCCVLLCGTSLQLAGEGRAPFHFSALLLLVKRNLGFVKFTFALWVVSRLPAHCHLALFLLLVLRLKLSKAVMVVTCLQSYNSGS